MRCADVIVYVAGESGIGSTTFAIIGRGFDVLMPTVRPKNFRSFVRSQGFHTIFLITPTWPIPTLLGIADDAVKRFASIQAANYLELVLHRYWWLPGREVARRIEIACFRRFAEYRERGSWLFMRPTEPEAFIEEEIARSGVWSATEVEMAEYVRSSQGRELRQIFSRPTPALKRVLTSSGRSCIDQDTLGADVPRPDQT